MATNIRILVSIALISAFSCILNVFAFPLVLPETQPTQLFLIFTSVNCGLWVVWKVLIYPYWFSPLRNLPQPKNSIPIIGQSGLIFEKPAGNTFLKFITEIPNQGIIRFLGPFNVDCLLLTDPKSLAEVLVHKSYDFEKPVRIRNFLRIILGDGLILVEGDEHKFQRKHLSPAFSFRNIKELHPIFWSKAVELKNCVATEIYENRKGSSHDDDAARVVEVNYWANKAAIDVIGVAGLGRDLQALKGSDNELIKNYEEILKPSSENTIYFGANLLLPRWLILMLPWKLNRGLKDATTALRNACYQIVNEKKELLKTEKEKHIDILSLLIKSTHFADDMLVDQLLTFLAAGHETTSSAFTWATYLLAKHQDIQTRLREEIRSRLPSPATDPNPGVDLGAILESLPLLNAVCNETLRLYPTVPVTMRVASRPTTILSQHVPEGTRINISPWAINRSPHLWGSDAADFRPERWIDPSTGYANNSGGVNSNYGNLTFLHGPRSCIGERFAKSELKALIAVWCGSFQMHMADPNEVPVPAGAITSKPKNGMKLLLQTLDGW